MIRIISTSRELRIVRMLIIIVMAGLILSGISALPIETELQKAEEVANQLGWDNSLTSWILLCQEGITATNRKYPFIAYGTDWLAFAHFVIAIAFLGPLMEPLRNKWVITFGVIAAVLIIPFAFTAGAVRGIPLFWRLIDCSFGIVGGCLLAICLRRINRIERRVAFRRYPEG